MTCITVTPQAHALGAEISGVDLKRPIPFETFSELQKAWADHLVLRFRGQALSDPELLALSRLFGELGPPEPNPYGKPFLSDFPEINFISNVKVNGAPAGNLGDGKVVWHCDMTYVDNPSRAAWLHALEILPSGGDTLWSNMYLAYETLPPEIKTKILGLRAIHDSTYNSARMMLISMKEVTDPREAPGDRSFWSSVTRRPAVLCTSSDAVATERSSAWNWPKAVRCSINSRIRQQNLSWRCGKYGKDMTSSSETTAAHCTVATPSIRMRYRVMHRTQIKSQAIVAVASA